MSVTISFTDEEREWIRWGIAHEGIPARALHHQETTWAHDSARQSVPVYEGVYTWEQGIADYAYGEKQRAFETFGHLLHLIIDAHPAALSGNGIDAPQKILIRTWRDVVAEENAHDTTALLQEGVDTLQRFFAEAQVPKVQRSNSLTVFFTKASSILQERVGFARTNMQRAFHGIRIAFARVPSTSVGGVAIPKTQTAVVAAEQEEVRVQENKKVQVTASVPVAPAPLPLATSIPLPPPPPEVILVPVDVSVPIVEPVVEVFIPQDTVPQIPETPLPSSPPPPPPQEELDVYGFPLGTVRTFNRAPPETTIATTPEQLTHVATATFVFSSSKEGTFFCTIDTGEEQACTSPMYVSELLDGNHTFAVRARDIWGTYDATPATYTWTIDTAPPPIVPPSPPPEPNPEPESNPSPPAIAIIKITEAHFQGNASVEYIVITNQGSAPQDFLGWKLHDAVATPLHTYTFGAFMLAAGATVTVHTGAGINTQTDLYWSSNISIWNDTGGDTAFLKDSGGALIDSVSW